MSPYTLVLASAVTVTGRVLDTTLRLLETHDLAGRVAALEAQAGAATGPRRLA